MRNLVTLTWMGLVMAASFLGCETKKLTFQPTGLMIELLSHPEEALLTDPLPEFSWVLNDSSRGAMQTAYQIQVFGSQQAVHDNKPDVWDSEKQSGSASVAVSYAGQPLTANQEYWWRVKVWTSTRGESDFSDVQHFRMSLLNDTIRKWPAESKWRQVNMGVEDQWMYEDRHAIRYQPISPANVVDLEDGVFLDFGKAAFATLELNLSREPEQPGQLIRIRLGEKLRSTNRVDTLPGASINYKKVTFPLEKGKTNYVIQLPRQHSNYPNSQVLVAHMPEVTPFRYAEIYGWPEPLNEQNVNQLALFYRFDDDASHFNSSNDTLNAVWDLCKYSLKATPFLGIYSDGTRERMPYEADAYIQQLGHYCVDREYAIARYTHKFLIYNPSWPTEWILHQVLIAWADYLYTGDAEALEAYYPELKHKMLMPLAREDGLLNSSQDNMDIALMQSIHFVQEAMHSSRPFIEDIVDWPHGPKPDNPQAFWSTQAGGEIDHYDFRPVNTVVNAFYYRNLVLMDRIASLLGNPEEAGIYEKAARKHRESFNRVLFDEEKGVYIDGEGSDHASLHANMFALVFGLVPDENVSGVMEFVKSRGLACSPYGAQYLLEALYDYGAGDVALDLMTNASDRGWVNMMRIGSTITTEAWDVKYKPNMDWNHAWGAAPANIIPRKLMGIEPLEPGFRTFSVRPRPGELRHAEIKMPTPRGSITCSWNNDTDRFTMELSVPANSNARVYLPLRTAEKISESGTPISMENSASELQVVDKSNTYWVLKVPSGTWYFEST